MEPVPAANPAQLTRAPRQASQDWRHSLRSAVRDAKTLRSAVGITSADPSGDEDNDYGFPLFVPWEYINRMEYGNPQDPLLRQVLPTAEESIELSGFSHDAVGDLAASAGHGLLKKYRGRALWVVNGVCAVHCRYCFRRHFPYAETGPAEWERALELIAADKSLEEVILSGGDPWTLTDSSLASILERLESFEHIRRIRFHTRLPILIPQRVTTRLLGILTQCRRQVSVVVHANHPRELCAETLGALQKLVRSGIPVLNQAVLLRGINDCEQVLAGLCRGLVDVGVYPYYLHQLDRVHGAAHFEVSETTGMALIRSLRGQLPGFAVPRYVREIAGGTGKEVIL